MAKGNVIIAGMVLLTAFTVKTGLARGTVVFTFKEPKADTIAVADSMRTVFGGADSVARVIFDEYYSTHRKRQEPQPDLPNGRASVDSTGGNDSSGHGQSPLQRRKGEILEAYGNFAMETGTPQDSSLQSVQAMLSKLRVIEGEADLAGVPLDGIADLKRGLEAAKIDARRREERAKQDTVPQKNHVDVALDLADSSITAMNLGNFVEAGNTLKLAKETAAGSGSDPQRLRATRLDSAYVMKLDSLVQKGISDSLDGIKNAIATMTIGNADSVKAALDSLEKQVKQVGNEGSKKKCKDAAASYNERRQLIEAFRDMY